MYYSYTSNAFTDNGRELRIRLFDSSLLANQTNEFTCAEISQQYNADESERFTSIISSELKFDFLVENSTHLALMQAIATSTGDRFFIELAINGIVNFFGAVNFGNLEFEDNAFPYFHEITVSDGLSNLKNIPFGEPNSAQISDSLIKVISYCLNKNTWLSAAYSGSYSLITAVDWHASNMITRAVNIDPLDNSFVKWYVFGVQKIEDNNTIQGIIDVIDWNAYTSWDVLAYIVSRFNARLFYANGMYNIIQVSNYKNASIFKRFYYSDGILDESLDESLLVSDLNRAGNFNYFSPVGRVIQKFVSIPNYSILKINFDQDKAAICNAGIYTYIVESATNYKIDGYIYANVIPANKPANLNDAKISLKISVISNNYSLSYDASAEEYIWNNNTTSYIDYLTDSFKVDDQVGSSLFATIKIKIPETLESCPLFFKIQVMGYKNNLDSYYQLRSFGTYLISSSVRYEGGILQDSSDSKVDIDFGLSVNGSNSKYSFSLDDQLMGDQYPVGYTANNTLKVYNGSVWQISGGWKDGKNAVSNTFIDISNLAMKDFLYDQFRPVKKFIGSIITNATFQNSLLFDGIEWVFLSGTYSYDFDEWTDCELFAIDKSATANVYTVVNDEKFPAPINTGALTAVNSASTSSLVTNITISSAITQLSENLFASTVTELPVDLMIHSILQPNDVIIIEHPNGINKEEFTVDSIQLVNDEIISVISKVIIIKYPIHSVIKFKGDLLARMVKHKKEGTVAGADISSTTMSSTNARINFSTGTFILNGSDSLINDIPVFDDVFPAGKIYKDENGFLKIV